MKLPDDIVASILSRLHPLEAVRAKLVCKAWRRASSSLSSFASGFLIELTSSPHPLLYADLSSLSWRPLPSLSQPASLLAIANSFLCLSVSSSTKPYRTQLHVFNPLTGAHVCIPHSLSRQAPFLVGLCINPHSHGFKVATAGSKALAESSRLFNADLNLPVQIYDSASNSWHSAGSISGAAPEYANPICMGSQVYWLSRRNHRKHVLIFDVQNESWRLIGVSSPPLWPQDIIPYTLWAWEGQICMAGEHNNALTVWKLTTDESEWILHTVFNPHVIRIKHFCGSKDIAGHGPLLCIMLVWARKGMVYDMRTHTKSWLPYCPVSSYNWGNVLPYRLSFSSLS